MSKFAPDVLGDRIMKPSPAPGLRIPDELDGI